MRRTAWLQERRMQKFRDVLSRWDRGELSMLEAGELLGCRSGSSGATGPVTRKRALMALSIAGWARCCRGGRRPMWLRDAAALPGALFRLEREALSRTPDSRSPSELDDSAFVAVDRVLLAEILCIEEERVVSRDNTVVFGRLKLQLPQNRFVTTMSRPRSRCASIPAPRWRCSTGRGSWRAMMQQATRSMQKRAQGRRVIRFDALALSTNRSGQMMCYQTGQLEKLPTDSECIVIF